MANQELIDYINHQRGHGATPANIKNALLHAGWEEGDVNAGLKATERPLETPPPPPQVVIKQDNPAGGQSVISSPSPAPKRTPILAIALLVISIVVVAAAAVAVYMIFLRPKSTAKTPLMPVAARATTTLVEQPPLDTASAPIPNNSEGGKVQDVPVSQP